MNPKLSIIIPAYNAEKTVETLLQSIDCSFIEGVEVIIVDDGSSDSTVTIVKDFKSRHTGYHIKLFQKTNDGVSSARNYGLQMASAEHIIFCDSDDELLSGALEVILKYLSIDADWIMYRIRRSDRGQSFHKSWQGQYTNKEIIDNMDGWLTDSGLLNSPVNKVYRNSIITKNKLRFREDLPLGEDLQFNLQYLEAAAGKIIVVEQELYLYNTNESVATVRYYPNYPEHRMAALVLLQAFYQRHGLSSELLDFLYIKYVYACVFMMMHEDSTAEYKDIVAFLHKIRQEENVLRAVTDYQSKGIIDKVLQFVLQLPFDGLAYFCIKLIRYSKRWISKGYSRASV